MGRAVRTLGVSLAVLAIAPLLAQEGHPLAGTWIGDWMPSATDRRHITLVVTWDGTALAGTINPGPGAVRVPNISLDVATWTVSFASGAVAVEGALNDIGSYHRTLTGLWSQGGAKGAFTLERSEASERALRVPPPVYDADRQLRIEGVVTSVDWINPRALVFVSARDAAGTTTSWSVDVGNPLDLERSGWTRHTLRAGDRVRIDAVPARGVSRRAQARAVVHIATGKRLFDAPAARSVAATKSPAPRWPDGQVRLGPPAGRKGYWGAASASTLLERGAKVDVSPDGLLKNLSDADRVAPLQPWAKALYLHRQRTLLADDPAARCLPPGGSRQFQMPHGLQFVEQRELGRILVLLGGGNRNWRVIHVDGRPQGQAAEVVLGYYGNSVGRWEKDTLVVDSVGFNERFWLTGGLPHTEALHLVERFTRPSLETLTYEVTFDDPRTYTRTWTAGWTIAWVPDREIQEYFCEEATP